MDAKQRAVIDLVLNGQQAQTTFREITKSVTTLRREIYNMREADNPKLYAERVAEMNKMLVIQQKMRNEITGTASAWQKVMGQIGTITTGILGADLVSGVLSQFSQAKAKVMEYKDSLADVSKATDMTTEEAAALNEQLKQINTRTPTKELREMAVAAGQFGVAKEQVDEFVESADRLNIALGDEFGGAEEVAKSALTMRNIFTDIKSAKIDDDMMHIGNALNYLSSQGAATAPVLADFSSRIGGTLIPLGLSSAKVLGYSATLQELNVTAERGSSGLINIFQKMLTETETFAKVAGVPLTEYKDLIGKDINQAFLKYVAGLQKVSGNQTEFMGVLEKSKLTGIGEMEVLSKLSTNMGLLTERTDQAGKALQNTDSITSEFNKRNHQLAQDLKTLDESFDSIYQSEAVQNFVASAVHGAVEFLQVLPKLYDWLKNNGDMLGVLAYALVMLNANLIRATLSSWLNTTAVIANRVAFYASYQLLVLQSALTAGYATAVGVLTGRITIATAAQRVWNLVMSLNPIGLIVTAIAALVAGIKLYTDNTKEAIELERKKTSLQTDSKRAVDLNAKAQADLNSKIAHYNELSKAEQAELKKTIALKETEARMRLANAFARAREIARAEAKPSAWQVAKQRVTNAVTGNWDADLDKQQKQMAEANKAQAYEEAKQLANADQLKNDWETIKKMRTDLDKPTTNVGVTGGGKGNSPLSTSEQDKAAKKAKSDAKKDADELERMLADSRTRVVAGAEGDYNKEVAAFAEKYSKMYDLAKDNEAKINEIRTLSLVEWAEIEKNFYDKKDEEARKQAEADNKTGFESAMHQADLDREGRNQQTDLGQAGHKIGDGEAQMLRLQSDQEYLTQKLLMEQTFAQQSAETEQQLTENANAQARLRAEATYQYAQEMKQAEWALQDAKRAAMSQGLEVLKGFLGKGTIAYKAAIIAQKAYAIAQVIVDMNREVAQIYANPAWSLMPDGGVTLKTAQATAARVRAGISIASIAATGIGELAAKKDGGYTGLRELYPGSGGPAGFTDGPTLFNMGQRSYIAGEAGREFVISNKALQNPAVANFARVLDVAQRSGNFGSMVSGQSGGALSTDPMPAGGSTGNNELYGAMMLLVQETQRNRAAMESYANRPIENNYRLQTQYEKNVDEIFNGLKL
jgi:TP901 family phage tail tape measure protein